MAPSLSLPISGLQGMLNYLNGDPLSRYGVNMAACKYAGLPAPYNQLDVLGALNYKNGTYNPNHATSTSHPGPQLDLNGVCNALAGTSGREALSALAKLAGLTN